ncbi:MAG: translocation/assembly module TamB domain-containing protein [Flavobacteriales bacterium]
MAWLALLPFFLLALVAVLIYLPPVQNVLRTKAVSFLEDKIGTPVQLEYLALRFPIGISLDGVLIHQQNGDTLLYAGSLKTRASLTALLNKTISLSSVDLADVRATVTQDRDSVFNFDYILTAFKGDTNAVKQPKDTTGGWGFTIGSVSLERIHADLDLQPSKLQLALRLGSLAVDFDEFDPGALRFHVDDLELSDTRADMRMASGPKEPDTYPNLKSPLAKMDIQFNTLDLENVAFTMKDVAKGDSLWLALPAAILKADRMDLAKQQLAFKKIELAAPVFGMLSTRHKDVEDVVHVDPPWLGENDGFRFYVRDWDLTARSVAISEGLVAMYTDTIAEPEKLFDPERLVLRDLGLDIKELVFNNEKVHAGKLDLALRVGPESKFVSLAVELDAIPDRFALENGEVEVAGNRIEFNAVANPENLTAFYRAPDQVPLKVKLRSKLDPDQLRPLLAEFGAAKFIPSNTTEQWDVKVDAVGSMVQLDSVRMDVVGNAGSVIHFAGRMKHMDQWPRSDLQLVLNEFTLGEGFRQVMQSFVPPGTVTPRRLTASVHAQGHDGSMQVRLNVNSDVGDVSGTAEVSGWKGKLPDDLSADLKVHQFDVSRFTGDTAIGTVSLHLTADAKDLNSSARQGKLILEPSQFRFNGNDLSSLRLNGDVKGDSLFVHLTTDAVPLKLALDARGKWPEKADSLALKMNLQVDRLQLDSLGLTAYKLDVEGAFQGSVALDTAGRGNIRLNADGLRLSNGKRAFEFDHFILQAHLGADSTALHLDSDGLTVNYHTNVAVDSILPRTKEKLASYFKRDPDFHPAPGKYMDLAITLPKSDWLAGLVLPQLNAITLKNFTGHYDSDADELAMNIDIPELNYDSILVDKLNLDVNAKGTDMDSKLSIRSIKRDSLGIFGLTLINTAELGGLKSSLRVQNGEFPPSYVLTTMLDRDAQGSTLHIQSEGLVLDSDPWTADPKNMLHFTDHGLVAETFTLSSGTQRLQVFTRENATRIDLEQFQIGTLLNFVTSQDSVPFVAGNLTGHVDLPTDGKSGLEANLTIASLDLLGNALGDLTVKAQETQKARYAASVNLKNGANLLDGTATVDASGTSPEIHGHADIGFTELNVFRPFTKTFLYELAGGLNGKLKFDMVHKKAALNGDLTFANTRIGLLATRSLFKLEKERITFDDAGIHLKQFTLKDSLGNAFTLNGDISTKDLSAPILDLTLRTDAFQLVNSVRGDNDLFYGDVLAGLDLTITGTANLPKLKGEIHVLKGTDLSIVLPGSQVKMVSHEGIVVFTNGEVASDSSDVASDSKMLQDSLKAKLKGFELDLHLLVDNTAKFSVVLDPTTGDAASFSGTGDLYFTYNSQGDMTLSGPFTVEDGGYTLEFYGLVKKRFDLVKGSTVTWNGDPLDAKIEIKARYTAEAAAYGLVAGSSALSQEQQNQLQQRLPFSVIISVDGSIARPDIDFGIELDRQYRNTYPMVSARLDQLAQKGNTDDRNLQVFGLLVTNAFIPADDAGAAPSSGLVSSAARNSVNGILTDQLNKLTGKYVKGFDISLGVNTVDQAEGNSTYQRTSVDYKVSKSFMNDRLSFEVGGSVGVDEQQEHGGGVSNTRAAQYVVYYDLTPSGKYRLRGFYENSFELYDGEVTKSGVAIQYTKDFEENERARTAAREAERKRKADEEANKRKARDAQQGPGTLTEPNDNGE